MGGDVTLRALQLRFSKNDSFRPYRLAGRSSKGGVPEMSQRVAGIQRTLPQVPTSSRSSRRHEKNIPRHITSEIKSRNHNKTRQMKMAHRQKLVVALACAVAATIRSR